MNSILLKKSIYLTLCLLFFINSLSAQNEPANYVLHLQTGKELVEENFDYFLEKEKIKKDEIVNGYYFRVVQFYDIPNTDQREEMERAGLTFINYISGKAYLMSIPEKLNKSYFKNKNIRAILPLKAAAKIDRSLREEPFGDWAVHGQELDVVVKFYDNLSLNLIESKLRNKGYIIIKGNEYMKLVYIQIPKTDIQKVAALPFVSYLELESDPGQPEDTRGRSLHRANMIDTEYAGGRKFDGAGVGVLVRDDGFVGPHIDFKGRMTQDVDDDGQIQHADGVAGIFGGAGNLDPNNRGMAAGSEMFVIDYQANFLDNTLPLHLSEGVMVTNSSYSNGCNAGYTTITQTVDRQMFENQSLLHVFSAGNSNNQDCDYGAGTQWGNITGGHKQGKNAIATANLNEDATLATTSSRGPAHDGRIKPDISANGRNQVSTDPFNTYAPFGGTSAAAPGVAGVSAQLYQAYKELNSGVNPPSGLIKATLMNTANDLGNIGPDFRFGWGHLNAYRAIRLLEDVRYETGMIENGANNTHTLSLPSGVSQVRVMVYWMEKEAFPGSSKALINDLDMIVTSPDGTTKLPWVLDPTPDPNTLNAPATNGEDHLNNVEQVLFDNPVAGDYTIDITGFEVPLGPQEYFLLYEIVTDEITVTYPVGGEGFEPNSPERLRWDAFGTAGQFVIDYTNDDGATWNNITTVNGTERMHLWLPPTDLTGQARVRVTNNMTNASDESDANFSIYRIPKNLAVTTFCPNYMTVTWDSVEQATGYDIFLLGEKFMDSVGTSVTNTFDIPMSNPLEEQWFSVRALGENGLRSERAVAVKYDDGLLNCVLDDDLSANVLLNPNVTSVVQCEPSSEFVSIQVENTGVNSQDSVSFSYQFNNGAIVTEDYMGTIEPGEILIYDFSTPIDFVSSGNATLKTWVTIPEDDVFFNDTITRNIILNLGEISTLPPTIVEDFEANNFPPNDWFISNTDGDFTWQTAEVISVTGNESQVAAMYNYIYDEPGERDELFTVPLDVSGVSNPVLAFDLAYARKTNNCSDTLRVEIYTNCGETLAEVVYEKFDNDLTTTSLKTFSWTPSGIADWRQEVVSLSGYIGDTILVKIVNINGDCNNLFIDNINIADYTIPASSFNVSPQEACVGEFVDFENTSQGVQLNYTWKFGSGAIPYNISTTEGPHQIQYFTSGMKEVRLITTNPLGADTAFFTVNVLDDPNVDFSYEIEGLGYRFTNESEFATDFFWDFGDNQESTEENPLHFYANPGDYTVKLKAANICADDFAIENITVTVTNVDDLEKEVKLQILPNPNEGVFNLEIEDEISRELNVTIFDLQGKSLGNWSLQSEVGKTFFPINKKELSQGVYLLKVESEVGVRTLKLIVQ